MVKALPTWKTVKVQLDDGFPDFPWRKPGFKWEDDIISDGLELEHDD